MAVETTNDRIALLADFGVSVTYTVQGGSATNIVGIFDNDFVNVDAGEDFGFAMQQPRLHQAKLRHLDGSRVVQDDGTGMTVVQLEKQ